MGRTFTQIATDMVSLHNRKNADYGNAFGKSYQKWGMKASLIRLGDKMNRLESLEGKSGQVEESVKDTLIDLAAYAIMTIEEMERNEK